MGVAIDRTRGREAHPVCDKQTGSLNTVTIVVALAALCLVDGCGESDRPHSQAVYEATSCPKPNIAGFPTLDFPANAQCGYLSVLEDRDKPEGRRIRIFVTRAPAVSAMPKPDPIVYLSGGPGGAGSFEVAFMVGHGINAERDVIFVDQRGTLHADPLLDCREFEQYIYDGVSIPFAAASTTAIAAASVKACHDRLAATGVDLAAYNSTENAADIAELRVALGIDSWNVYGVSYGSKLALIVLRNHPQGIRSVVLDSVSPPNNNIVETWWSAPAGSFKAILAACAAQPACAAAYPNTGSRLHGHGEPPRCDAGHHPAHRPVRRARDGQRRRLRILVHADHVERARPCLGPAEDDARHGARRRRLCRCRVPGVARPAGDHRPGRPRPGVHRVLRGARQSDDRGRHVGSLEGRAARIPGAGAADPAQAGTSLHRVSDLERRQGIPFGGRPGRRAICRC